MFALILACSALLASPDSLSDARNEDASQWTGRDAFIILNGSPWSKKIKLKPSTEGLNGLSDQGGSNAPGNQPMPASAGGMGRRGMGGGRSRTYSSSGNTAQNSGNNRNTPSEVTVQWQSALVVRLAVAKNAGETIDPHVFPPLDHYVIAVIGLPVTFLGGPAASTDSQILSDPAIVKQLADKVKASAVLLRSGHEALPPDKVEIDQGNDGRLLLYFPKSQPISANEKSIEFRLGEGKSALKTKFLLKEMEYQGKLEL